MLLLVLVFVVGVLVLVNVVITVADVIVLKLVPSVCVNSNEPGTSYMGVFHVFVILTNLRHLILLIPHILMPFRRYFRVIR